MKKKSTIYAKYWTSNHNEGRHFGDHGWQMDFMDNDEGKELFSEKAYELSINSSQSIEIYNRKDGCTVKYDKENNYFIVLNADGLIISFFKMSLKNFIKYRNKYLI